MEMITIHQSGDVRVGAHEISIPHYTILSVVGHGANGVVFKARHDFLGREDAVKVWLRLKQRDDRDKFLQGIEEARKAVSLNSTYVVPIYYAGDTNGLFYCSMPFIESPTLHELLSEALYCDYAQKHAIATLFLDAVFKTSREGVFHGDLHLKNIIVTDHSIRLLDFGTSRFTSKANLEKRHWRIVHETFKAILSPFDIDKLYHGITRYDPKRLYNPTQSVLPPSMYYLFLSQIPFFITHNWTAELDLFDLPVPDVSVGRGATDIHPTVSRRLRALKHAISADSLMPLLQRLELPEDLGAYDKCSTETFYHFDWKADVNEAVPIKLNCKPTR